MAFLLKSAYFQIWSNQFTLSSSTKQKYISVLKKFEAFLLHNGFEGELDFDQFHASREHPGRFLPIQRQVFDRFFMDLKQHEHMSNMNLAATITVRISRQNLNGIYNIQNLNLVFRGTSTCSINKERL